MDPQSDLARLRLVVFRTILLLEIIPYGQHTVPGTIDL
jgi:hypothetical protein